MSRETELKFQIPPAALPALRAALTAPDLPGAQGPSHTLRLAASYLDTADGALARGRAALRVRLEGTQWVQTLKAEGAGALTRLEHEVPLPDAAEGPVPASDLARHDGHPAGARLRALLAEAAPAGPVPPLRERYRTDLRRTLRTVVHHGAEGELALDEGEISAAGGTRRGAVLELEAELRHGPLPALLDLAERWVQAHGLVLDARSKSERGHGLAEGLQVSPPQPWPDAAALQALAPAARWSAWLRPLLANASQLLDGAGTAAHVRGVQAALQGLLDVSPPEPGSRGRWPLDPAARAHAAWLQAQAPDADWPALLRQAATQRLWLQLLAPAGA